MQVKYKIIVCIDDELFNYGNRDERVEYREGQWITSCEATHLLYNTRRQAKIFLINQMWYFSYIEGANTNRWDIRIYKCLHDTNNIKLLYVVNTNKDIVFEYPHPSLGKAVDKATNKLIEEKKLQGCKIVELLTEGGILS